MRSSGWTRGSTPQYGADSCWCNSCWCIWEGRQSRGSDIVQCGAVSSRSDNMEYSAYGTLTSHAYRVWVGGGPMNLVASFGWWWLWSLICRDATTSSTGVRWFVVCMKTATLIGRVHGSLAVDASLPVGLSWWFIPAGLPPTTSENSDWKEYLWSDEYVFGTVAFQ